MSIVGPLSSSNGQSADHSLASLQRCQIRSILLQTSSASQSPWFILIHDGFTSSLLNPLLTVRDLRELGVTLHVNLFKNRADDGVVNVPCVYFVEPTDENIDRICKDVEGAVYGGGVHVNFTRKLKREMLERLGKSIAATPNRVNIKGLWDRYQHYVTLNPNVYSLSMSPSVSGCKVLAKSNDMQSIRRYVGVAAEGIASVVNGLSEVYDLPVIRCGGGGICEMLCKEVNDVLRSKAAAARQRGPGGSGPSDAKSSSSSFSSSLSSSMANGGRHRQRPVLIVVDRYSDPLPVITHASSYQSLLSDTTTYNGNGSVGSHADAGTAADKQSSKSKWTFGEEDDWWLKHKFVDFPDAVEGNGKELSEVSSKESSIRNLQSTAAPTLLDAVDDLPKLLSRKKSLETHTSILQHVMESVSSRDLPVYYDLETKLSSKSAVKETLKRDVLELISNGKGTEVDKVRLAICYSLSAHTTTSEVQAMWDEVIPAATQNSYLGVKSYVMELRSVSALASGSSASSASILSTTTSDPSSASKTNSAILSAVTKSAVGIGGTILANAKEKVGSLMGVGKMYATTKTVCNIMNEVQSTEYDSYLYMDPLARGTGASSMASSSSSSSNTPPHPPPSSLGSSRLPRHSLAIVFCVGGGGWEEYHNLNANKGEWNIVYGGDNIIKSEDIVKQINM